VFAAPGNTRSDDVVFVSLLVAFNGDSTGPVIVSCSVGIIVVMRAFAVFFGELNVVAVISSVGVVIVVVVVVVVVSVAASDCVVRGAESDSAFVDFV